jgi:hypothetical protein
LLQVGGSVYDFYIPEWVGVDPANGNPLWKTITTDANGNTVVGTTSEYAKATKTLQGSSLPKVMEVLVQASITKTLISQHW